MVTADPNKAKQVYNYLVKIADIPGKMVAQKRSAGGNIDLVFDLEDPADKKGIVFNLRADAKERKTLGILSVS